MDGWTNGRMDGPTKQGVVSRSMRLKRDMFASIIGRIPTVFRYTGIQLYFIIIDSLNYSVHAPYHVFSCNVGGGGVGKTNNSRPKGEGAERGNLAKVQLEIQRELFCCLSFFLSL